jgi:polysaccharide biosynthesis protein PslH
MAQTAVILCSWFPFPVTSGNRKRAVRLAEAIERAGATPLILSAERPPPDGIEELEARGWRHAAATGNGGRRMSRVEQHVRGLPFAEPPTLGPELRRLAAEAAFVQLEEYRVFQYARFVPDGVPTAMSAHNVDSQLIDTSTPRGPRFGPSWWSAAWYVKRMQLTERRVAKEADAVICVSEDDRDYFARYGDNVVVAPNGIDDELLSVGASAPDGDGVLFFGQLSYAPNREGLSRLLDGIWQRVRAERPEARLRVAGPGCDLPEVQAMARGVEGVELVGFVPDLKAELGRNRVVVAPLWSGGGTRIKVLEALAAARPVVGTSFGVGGVGFRDGVHGRVGETPDELARGVIDLLSDDEAWRVAAAQGRELAAGARWSEATAPAERVYRAWLERRAA